MMIGARERAREAFRSAYHPELDEAAKVELYAQHAHLICDPDALAGPPEDPWSPSSQP